MNAIIQRTCLNDILTAYNIHPKFHAEFHELVERGVRPGKELRIRLNNVVNYRIALDTAMAELCKPRRHQFPPTVFNPF